MLGDSAMEWNWSCDRLSVHVGINYRIGVCKAQGRRPSRVLLSPELTRLYMQEKGWSALPRGTHTYEGLPLRFNVRGAPGIVVESVPP